MTMGQFLPTMAKHTFNIAKLTGAFSEILEEVVTDPFIRNWFDLLCFLLSGLPANGTSAAEVAFMFAEWYRPGVVLDYPIGGSGAIVDALVRGLKRHGGQLMLNAHVEEIVIRGGRAVGVLLQNGEEIRAKQAVVSNASVWDTLKLLSEDAVSTSWREERQATPECNSFMHLHLGIDATDIKPDLSCHHIIVNHWDQIDAPQNVVLVSIPSLIDSTLAPPKKHVIHVYTPGNEPYQLWQGMDRKSQEYAQQKQERAEVMWRGLERIIPDIRSRCEVKLVGTPITHERFLRRHRGSYGPAIRAGEGLFPGPIALPGLLCCGDSTFPGIGLPAVAVSGMIAANTLAPVSKHREMLERLVISTPGN